MTDHTHVREAEVHYVDTATCVHRLRGVGSLSRWQHLNPAAQCPRQPAFLVAGLPACDGHAVAVIVWEHQRGNPDPVVRRWV